MEKYYKSHDLSPRRVAEWIEQRDGCVSDFILDYVSTHEAEVAEALLKYLLER